MTDSSRFGRALVACLLLLIVRTLTVAPQSLDDEEERGNPVLQLSFREIAEALETGRLTLDEVRRAGMEVFTRPMGSADGFGDGPFDPAELQRPFPGSTPESIHSLFPGRRPTLQGNGTTLGVNGLDAQSCNECHSIVSHDTIPPTLGIGGVGGIAQNAIIAPTVIDVSDSREHRVVGSAPGGGFMAPDGVADFNGRESNPPFLYGGGGVELLAKEMTADLHGLLRQARTAAPGAVTRLLTHGVDFGFLRTEAPGLVDLEGVEGIGFEHNEGRRPEDVLVVRPFGRKGEFFSMREFDVAAMRFHFGIQPTEFVGADVDDDGDGVVNEISDGAMTALHLFDVTNPPPVMQGLDAAAQAGFDTFQRIGCADCHRPVLETRSRYLPLAHPGVAEDPQANVYFSVDLVEVGFAPSPNGGVYVPLFADLKRHAMGPELEETAHFAEVGNDMFTTARLWGVGDTAPYLHDGRALDIRDAILAHGGEAQAARDAFNGLGTAAQGNLVRFLRKLRAPSNPNVELLDVTTPSRSLHPQPTGLTVSPDTVSRSNNECYAMIVENGAGMTLDVTFTLNGVPADPVIGWPRLNENGVNTDPICVTEEASVGTYVFTGIRNTLNAGSLFVPVHAGVTVVE